MKRVVEDAEEEKAGQEGLEGVQMCFVPGEIKDIASGLARKR